MKKLLFVLLTALFAGTVTAQIPSVSILGDSYSTYEDFVTPATNELWYYAQNGEGKTDVKDVSQTWWHQVIKDNTRMDNLGSPDIIFVFGATNDSWAGAPVGEYKYDGITKADMYFFRPALAHMLKWMTDYYLNTKIYFVLNDDLRDEIDESVKTICARYGVPVIELEGIDKISGHPSVKGMRQIADQVNRFVKK